MTRPRRPANNSGKQPSSKGSRGHAPQKMTAQGRGGMTRENTRPAHENTQGSSEPRAERQSDRPRSTTRAGSATGSAGSSNASGRRYGSASSDARGGKSSGTARGSKSASASETGRKAPPRIVRSKAMPELKRVQLDAPAPDTVFVDRDGEKVTFPESNLRRVAARILAERNKAWRYRPFAFPIFTDKGHEQSFHFDFYIYDAEESVIRLILVVPHESREVWDKVGRFKRQYPMYTYELWTPEKLAQLDGPRGRLGW